MLKKGVFCGYKNHTFNFARTNLNQINNIIPFSIEEILMLHQTPDNPNTVELSISANGILNTFNTTPLTVGCNVLPRPLKAPIVPI
ncbi:hypothetical protein SDC9_68887 [bioreactor metagenome]|uniref:Uncharacterized protein n=1 Tax=bioreactor metagenome TaxID=1076179 RepID=A0A644Y1N5_9ZZZZ